MVGQLSALTILSFAVGVVQNRLNEPSMDTSRNLKQDVVCASGVTYPAETIRAPLRVLIGHNWGIVDEKNKKHVRAIVSKANEIMKREVNFELVIDRFRPYTVPTCQNSTRVLLDLQDNYYATREHFTHLFSTRECFGGGRGIINQGALCGDFNCVGLSGMEPNESGSNFSESDVGVFVHEIFHNLGAKHSEKGIMVEEKPGDGFRSTDLDARNKCIIFRNLKASMESKDISWIHERY